MPSGTRTAAVMCLLFSSFPAPQPATEKKASNNRTGASCDPGHIQIPSDSPTLQLSLSKLPEGHKRVIFLL